MDSPPTSESPRFFDLSGMPIQGPREWEACWMAIREPDRGWERCEVLSNGRLLPVAARAIPPTGRVLAVAEWPRSEPGAYQIQILAPGEPDRRFTISIASRKLSPGAYQRMVEDLETRLPVSIALALQRMGALAGFELRPFSHLTRAQELALLERAVDGTPHRPGLVSILHDLRSAPHRTLRTVEVWTRAEAARRPDPGRLPEALLRPRNARRSAVIPAPGAPSGIRLDRVIDTRAEQTFDVYENRLLAAYIRTVDRRLRHLGRSGSATDPLPARVGQIRERLGRSCSRAAFLEGVAPAAVPPIRPSMVLLRRPPYRAALEGYLELHQRPFVVLDDPALEAPVNNLPRLYQLWGTLETINTLMGAAVRLGFRATDHSLMRRMPGAVYVSILPNGASSARLRHEESGTEVRVIPERTYGMRGNLHSLTYEQRPDLAVEISRAGTPTRVLIFDPKYKLDGEVKAGMTSMRPLKTDIDKMHTYRDAVRDAEGNRTVDYAAILYPGEGVRFPAAPDVPPQVEALRADPGNSELLHDRLSRLFESVLRRSVAG